MENKQLTAVEWFASELAEILPMVDDMETANKLFGAYLKAKRMEQDQMEKAVSYAISNADMTNNKGYFNIQEYYNQTFEQ